MKKILIIFYSRTGVTKKIAEVIKRRLGAESEEIISLKNRQGAIGYLLSGLEASRKTLAKIKPAVINPADYDLVIIGTPIWAWNLSSPVRAYLTEQSGKFKKVAFFCTMGGSGDDKAFAEMEKICGLKPLATLALTTKKVMTNDYEIEINDFIVRLR
jgi:flavodoxin